MLKKKQLIGMITILALFTVVANSTKVSAFAPKQFKELEINKEYSEDLDCDGENEQVICKQTDVKNDENKKTLTISIKDDIAFEKTVKCQYFTIHLADIDGTDNNQDLFITARDYGGICLKTFYLQYRDYKLKLIQTLDRKDGPQYLNLAMYFWGQVAKDASFQLISVRPMGDAIGDYACFIPYKLMNGKIAAVKTNTYNLTPDSKKYRYQAKKKFVTYKSVNTGTAAAFRVNTGDEVRADKVYVSKKGKCYIRIINRNNAKGWIDASQDDLFVRGPIWD
jgi:hypothetical protein